MSDIVLVCEICNGNVGFVSDDAKAPLQGMHFDSYDPLHGWPKPFRSPVITWEWLICIHCGHRVSIKPDTIKTSVGMLTADAHGLVDEKGKRVIGKEPAKVAPKPATPVQPAPAPAGAPTPAAKTKEEATTTAAKPAPGTVMPPKKTAAKKTTPKKASK